MNKQFVKDAMTQGSISIEKSTFDGMRIYLTADVFDDFLDEVELTSVTDMEKDIYVLTYDSFHKQLDLS